VTKAEKKGSYMKKAVHDKKPMIPKFKSEDEERDFWATHDFTDYAHCFQPVQLDLSNLKPSTESITIRLPQFLVARLKQLANKQDVPYQSLMKIYLADRVNKELHASA
jgi:predicted DNA binding CopG/RHH family protein